MPTDKPNKDDGRKAREKRKADDAYVDSVNDASFPASDPPPYYAGSLKQKADKEAKDD